MGRIVGLTIKTEGKAAKGTELVPAPKAGEGNAKPTKTPAKPKGE